MLIKAKNQHESVNQSQADNQQMPTDQQQAAANTDSPVAESTDQEQAQTAGNEPDLAEKLAQKSQQFDDLTVQYTRLRADFDNYRRRTRLEIEEITGRANEKLIERLLPVLDNLDRACAAANATDNETSMRAGLELVQRGLMDLLVSEGLEEVPGVGALFDPYVHEAVDRAGDNPTHVIAVYQKGYKLLGKVLRAAMVKVGPEPVADTVEQ